MVAVTISGTIFGSALSQTTPISHESSVTLAIGGTAVAFAFAVGALLTGIKRDIKELRGAIHRLPCRDKNDECDDEDKPKHKKE